MKLMNILSNSRFRYINPFIFFTLSKLIREKKASHLILEHPYYGWLGISAENSFVALSWWFIHIIWKGNDGKALENGGGASCGTMKKSPTGRQITIFLFRMKTEIMQLKHLLWMRTTCLTVSFGTEILSTYQLENRTEAARILQPAIANPDQTFLLLLFNGAFKYAPNRRSPGKSAVSESIPYYRTGDFLI